MKKILGVLLFLWLLSGCDALPRASCRIEVSTFRDFGPYSIEVTAWDNTTGESLHNKTEHAAAGSWGPGYLYYPRGHNVDVKVVVSGGGKIPIGMKVIITDGPNRRSCGPLPGQEQLKAITCTAKMSQ